MLIKGRRFKINGQRIAKLIAIIVSTALLTGCGKVHKHTGSENNIKNSKTSSKKLKKIDVNMKLLNAHTKYIPTQTNMYEGVAPKKGWGKIVVSDYPNKQVNGTVINLTPKNHTLTNGIVLLSESGNSNDGYGLTGGDDAYNFTEKHAFNIDRDWTINTGKITNLKPLKTINTDKFKKSIVDSVNQKNNYGHFTTADIVLITGFGPNSDYSHTIDALLVNGKKRIQVEFWIEDLYTSDNQLIAPKLGTSVQSATRALINQNGTYITSKDDLFQNEQLIKQNKN